MSAGSRGGLPGLAVRRPVTMLMLFLSLIVVGAVALRGIPLQLFPAGFDPPFLYVWLFHPDVTPIDNQRRIATPVEESLWTVRGVKQMESRINSRGVGILVEFQQTVDMTTAWLDVRDRLDRAKPDLPDDLRNIYIWRYSESDEPILYCALSINGDYEDPHRIIREEVVRRLERIDGVAKVELWGGNAREVRVDFLLDRLKAHQVDVGLLINDLRNANFALAGGTIFDGERQMLLRVDARLHNMEEIENLPIRGRDLRLKDVANVMFAEPAPGWIQRIGRREAVELGIYKTSEANTVELCELLNQTISGIEKLPIAAGFNFEVLFDQGKYIRESLDNLGTSGLWGAFFAFLILWLFLRRLRMTLFITLAIPLSLMGTLICLYFMGWSLNIITLSGLMISVGMVVDNAIVVVENIHTTRQNGIPAARAAVQGASEVALAITLATLTTAVVFLPLILMSGDRMLTFFMLRIGLPVIFALLFSLMAALMFIPLLAHRASRRDDDRQARMPILPGRTDWIDRIARKVEGLVGWCLNHRRDTVLISLALLASIAIPMKVVVSTDQEEGHINDLRVHFVFPVYYSLRDADSTITRMEDLIYSKADEYNVRTVVTGFRSTQGRMRIFMNEEPRSMWLAAGVKRLGRKLGLFKTEYMSREKVIKDLKERFKAPPGVEMHTSWGTGVKESAEYVSIYGRDADRLLDIAARLKDRLEELPEVLSVQTDLEPSNNEVQIRFERTETGRFAVDPLQTGMGITSMIRGIDLPDIRLGGYDIEGSVGLRAQDRTTLMQVMNLPVGGMRGDTIQLADVAAVEYARGLGEITSENRRTRLRLKITTTEDDIGKLSRSIDRMMQNVTLPQGYEWGKGRHFEEVIEARRERSNAWLLALMFVFLLMSALFESFILPWAVIVTVPFSFFGVWWALMLTGTQFGIMSAVGVIILIGIVVNNAIILVDRVNRLRDEGMLREEALKTAARQRFRPIAMTALTTIMGLLPMAFGDTNLIGIPYAPMGRAIIGGMIAATMFTPVIVPIAYSYIDDLKNWLTAYARLFKR